MQQIVLLKACQTDSFKYFRFCKIITAASIYAYLFEDEPVSRMIHLVEKDQHSQKSYCFPAISAEIQSTLS
jgi:hypothetical protein